MTVITRFCALPARDRFAASEAVLLLLTVRIAFAALPLPHVLRLFGIAQGKTGNGRVDGDEAEAVSRAIARASPHVPFHAACLQQAFAALLMLRRRGLAASVHLGLMRQDGGLQAHAWSQCGDMLVTGAAAARAFAPIAAFAA